MPHLPCANPRGAASAAIGLLLAGLQLAHADTTADRHYVGIAYDDGSQRIAYREEHFVLGSADPRSRLVLYRCASGQPFARKWVHDVTTGSAPDFELLDARSGYREGVSSDGDGRAVFYQTNRLTPTRSARLLDRSNSVVDAGFDAYVREHWSALDHQGPIAFVVPSRLGYVNLAIAEGPAGAVDGTASRQLRLSLDAWYSFAIPPIVLTYDASTHRLLRFEGISNIRNVDGKNQRVRIEFPRDEELSAPTRAEFLAAEALPLSSSCTP